MKTKKINVLYFAYNACEIRSTANVQFIVHGKLSLINVDLCENTSNSERCS